MHFYGIVIVQATEHKINKYCSSELNIQHGVQDLRSSRSRGGEVGRKNERKALVAPPPRLNLEGVRRNEGRKQGAVGCWASGEPPDIGVSRRWQDRLKIELVKTSRPPILVGGDLGANIPITRRLPPIQKPTE